MSFSAASKKKTRPLFAKLRTPVSLWSLVLQHPTNVFLSSFSRLHLQFVPAWNCLWDHLNSPHCLPTTMNKFQSSWLLFTLFFVLPQIGDCGWSSPPTYDIFALSLSSVLRHRYAIDRRTDMDHLFNVHPGNGSVFLLKSLDREESAWHNISVIATELRKSRGGQGYLQRWLQKNV